MRTRYKVIAQTSVSLPAVASNSSNATAYCNHTSPYTKTVAAPDSRTAAVYDTDQIVHMMADEVGNRRRPHGVRHMKCHTVLRGVEARVTSGQTIISTSNTTGYTVYNGGLGDHYSLAGQSADVAGLKANLLTWGEIPGVTFSWARSDDRAVVQRLYDRARKPVVEGLLNIVESPELPSAIESFTRNVPKATEYWDLKSAWKSAKRDLGRASKRIANRYLAYSFGIAPLIADVNKLWSFMDTIRVDYEKYARGAVKRMHSIHMGAYNFSMSASGVKTYQGFCTMWPTTRYVLAYRERVPYDTDFFRKLDYGLSRFGAAGPASFAWERVPFSFVVDWFVDSASLLQSLDEGLARDPIETLSLTKSHKMECTTEVFRTIQRTDTSSVVYGPAKQGSVTHTVYERMPLGRVNYIDTSVRFGKRQAATSVALLRQLLK